MSRPRGVHPSRALAAALAALVLSGCAAASGGGTGEGSAVVEVDIFSGRENPRVPLCADAAGRLQVLVDERDESALPSGSAAEPELGLGFRGFLVTSATDEGSPVRLTPDAAYLERGGGTVVIVDGAGAVFDAVLACIKSELDPALVEEIERSIP